MVEQRTKREWVERDGLIYLKIVQEAKNLDTDEFVKIEEQEVETKQTREQVIASLNDQITKLQAERDELQSRPIVRG